MNKLITIIVFFSYLSFAKAEENFHFGRALYALQNSNYNCDALIKSIKDVKDFRYSWLYNTFDNIADGANLDCVQKLNNLPQTTLMEVHLINEVCQRNKNCGSYEFLNQTTISNYQAGLINQDPKLIQNLEDYFALSAKRILPTLNDQIRCFVSTGLESNLNHRAAEVLINLAKKHYANRCKIVWNPVNNNKFSQAIAGTVHELHGSTQRLNAPCLANLDGEDIDFPDRKSFLPGPKISHFKVKNYIKQNLHCEAVFLWIAEDNCIHKDLKLDPRTRTNCTNYELQKKLFSITKEKGSD